MPNIGVVLKEEISRLSRKEIRRHIETMRKASTQYRRNIAALKKQVGKLERQVATLSGSVFDKPRAATAAKGATRVRFVAKGLRPQRERLGLSAGDYAKLLGVSAQSVYNWERGVARPRVEQIAALAALRGMGKNEARARLEQASAKAPRKRPA